jgi:putative zinc finger protein
MAHQAHPSACEAYEEDLVLLHYGDLSGAERGKLESHLSSCAGCAAYLRELATLLPLTVKSDEPPQEFWRNYNRELRAKLDEVAAKKTWWRNLVQAFRPGYVTAFVAAAIVVLALTFTLGKAFWYANSNSQDDEMAEALPVAENLDFFTAMDILDDLDLLELIGNQNNNAA